MKFIVPQILAIAALSASSAGKDLPEWMLQFKDSEKKNDQGIIEQHRHFYHKSGEKDDNVYDHKHYHVYKITTVAMTKEVPEPYPVYKLVYVPVKKVVEKKVKDPAKKKVHVPVRAPHKAPAPKSYPLPVAKKASQPLPKNPIHFKVLPVEEAKVLGVQKFPEPIYHEKVPVQVKKAPESLAKLSGVSYTKIPVHTKKVPESFLKVAEPFHFKQTPIHVKDVPEKLPLPYQVPYYLNHYQPHVVYYLKTPQHHHISAESNNQSSEEFFDWI